MTRIRTLAALAAAVAIAACADMPTAPAPAAPASSLASTSTCSPTMSGPTAVNSGTIYTYRMYNVTPDCLSSVSWSVFGGTITQTAGGKIWVNPHDTNCMQVTATAYFIGGGSQTYTVLAKVNGYKFTCYELG
jgi:hypothetical protein